MTKLISPSIDEAKNYIYSIDFTAITNKMIHHLKWKKSEVEKTCQLYRNFLFLQKKYGDEFTLPPSEEIDEFWHNHILDTKKYRHDCEQIFGKYLDHYPYLGIDEKTNLDDLWKAYDLTQKFHKKEFGYFIERVKKIKISEIILDLLTAIKAGLFKKLLRKIK